MTDETLQTLLRAADAEPANPPTISADALLAAARRRRGQATQRHIATATLATACVLVGAWTLALNSTPIPHKTSHHISASSPTDRSLKRPVQRASADQIRLELARLDYDADLARRIVHAVLEQPAIANAAPPESQLPDADLVRLEAARSAALAWQHANVVERELRDPATARLEYQRLVDRFPGTQWADLAASSLRRQ
jgi:hypothetical protein